jgi:23S rRNA (uracil1939-C5)-methyltransferase
VRLEVRALRPVYGGYTFAHDGVTFFIRGALPGELVSVVVRERKKGCAFADAVEILTPSPHRVRPPCPVYGACGGCQLQHASYEYQLVLKALVLEDALRRIGGIACGPSAVHGSAPFGYRHRGQFKTRGGAIGFFREGSNDLVSVDRCPLMIGAINGRLAVCRDAAAAVAARDVHIESDGVRTVVSFPGMPSDRAAADRLAREGIAGIRFEDGRFGDDTLSFDRKGSSYAVSAGSFFQANWRMNIELIGRIETLVGDSPGARLLDLYAGAGNFSIPLARQVGEVVAVEESASAFADLRRNLERNGLRNLTAVRSRTERFRPKGRFDFVIVDPPRSGISDKAFRLVRALSPGTVLYVSCNPSTLARDLKKFSALYDVEAVELFDFFPNTYHIETLAVLRRRG